MKRNIIHLCVFILILGIASIANAQATRTWVSGVGDDANPCSRTAPCKTFPGAQSKTAANGEINAMDPGGFGAITINKSLTLDSYGQIAGVLTSSGFNAVTINAASTDVVILRDLDINGAGTANDGIRILNAKTVIIERCKIYGFAGQGIEIAPGASPVKVYVHDSEISRNGSHGILVLPTGAGTVDLTVSGTRVLGNGGNGVDVAGVNNRATVTGSVINGNFAGVIVEQTSSTGFIESSTVAYNQHGVWSGSAAGSTPVVRISRTLVVGNTVNGLTSTLGGGGFGTIVGFQNNTVVGNAGNNSVNSSSAQQ